MSPLYRLVRQGVHVLLRVFYRRLDVLGLEHVPPAGPWWSPPITRTA